MGKTILELFQTKKLTGTQTAQQKYETRNSKDIPISTPNGVLNATSFALVNKLRRSNISDRTKETVIEEELLGLRQLRFLSQPIIYGTDIIRLNRLSTNMLDDMKAGTGNNAANNGIIGNALNKLKTKGLSLASKLGIAFPEEVIPSRIVLKDDFKYGLEPNTMQTLAKIRKDAAGTLTGKFLAQNVKGTPQQIGNAILGSGIQLAKDKVQTYLFGARKSGQQLLAKNNPTSHLYSSAMPYKETVDYTGVDLKLRNDLSSLHNELSTIKKDGPANLSGEFLRLSKTPKSSDLFGDILNNSAKSNTFTIPSKGQVISNVFTIPKLNANNLIGGRKEGQQNLGKELTKVGTGEGILKYNADNTITKYSNTVDEESLVIDQRNDLSTRLKQIGGVDPASLAIINGTTKDKQSTTSIGAQFAGLNKKTQQEKSLFKALAGENGLSLPNGVVIPPPAKASDLLAARKEGQRELGKKVQESKGNDLLKYDPRLSATAYSNTVDETNDDEKSRNDLSTLLNTIQTVAEKTSTGNELNITGIGNKGVPQRAEKLKYSSEEFANSIEAKKSLGNAVNFLNTKNHYTDTGNDTFGDLDFITVKFTSVPNKKSVNFTATITAISETISPSWDSAKFLGSAFNYYTYGGIERSVSFTLTLYSTNSQEHVAMWERINFLTSLAYPAGYYGETYVIAPFTKVTIGDLYKDKECIIESLAYTVDDTAGWEIGSNKSYGGNGGKVNIETDGDNAEVAKSVNGYKLPMVVSVNMGLKFMESRNNTVNKFYGFNTTLPANATEKKVQETKPQKKKESSKTNTENNVPKSVMSTENYNKKIQQEKEKIDKANPFNSILNKGKNPGGLLGVAGF